VILPLIGFIWIMYLRRNAALDLLSEVKCALLYVLRAHSVILRDENAETNVGAAHAHSLTKAYEDILTSMHDYFLPARFYSRRYPYIGYKSAMVCVSV